MFENNETSQYMKSADLSQSATIQSFLVVRPASCTFLSPEHLRRVWNRVPFCTNNLQWIRILNEKNRTFSITSFQRCKHNWWLHDVQLVPQVWRNSPSRRLNSKWRHHAPQRRLTFCTHTKSKRKQLDFPFVICQLQVNFLKCSTCELGRNILH